jgi:hypothetical protein
MYYYGRRIDFPIAELMDESICAIWLKRHLHPHGRDAHTVGTLHGACSTHRVTFRPTGVELAMATTPC